MKISFLALALLSSVNFPQMGLAVPSAQKLSKIPLDAHGKPIFPKVSNLTSIHFSKVLPSNFIPAYPGATVSNFANTTKGSPAASSTMTSKDAPDTVLRWYQDYLSKEHWEVRAPSSSSLQKLGKQGTTNFLNAEKGSQQATIVCIKSPKTGLTIVSVSWSLQPRSSF